VENGLEHVGGIGNIGNLNDGRDPCPGCGMGGPRPFGGTVVQGDVQIGDVIGASDSQQAPVRRLLAGQRPGMRACYNNGLKADPSQEGTVLATIVWTSTGDVQTVTTNSNSSTIEASTATCVGARLRRMVKTPDLAGATISVRLRFTLQR